MSYPEALAYLQTFVNYEKAASYSYKQSLKLERIAGFCAAIGDPQRSLKCIHVAGSKGKGSTCMFIASILREAGFCVGLYTSPHLADFRERIRILSPSASARDRGDEFEGMISCDDVAAIVDALKARIEAYNKESACGPLTFFEVYTALAFVYFKERAVDYAVLETGVGGRLDATNTVCARVSAITPISYEHMDKLGNTLREIAGEKAGIIKRCGDAQPVVVSAAQDPEAAAVIRRRCGETGAQLYEVDKDIVCAPGVGRFDIKGMYGEYRNLTTQLSGRHQMMNAAVAVGAVEALRRFGLTVDAEAISRGLACARWPGRCEILRRDPLVVLDGAQNAASCRVLKETMVSDFKYRRLFVVLGVSGDKDIRGICREVSSIADTVIVTKADNPRACDPEELARHFRDKQVHVTHSVKDARSLAYESAGPGDAVLVCGSLFVVGEFKYGTTAQ